MSIFNTNPLVNIDIATDIHYGVCSQNENTYEEMYNNASSINLSYETWKDDQMNYLQGLKESIEKGICIKKKHLIDVIHSLQAYRYLSSSSAIEYLVKANEDLATQETLRNFISELIEDVKLPEYEEDNDTYLIGDWLYNETTETYAISKEGLKGYSAQTVGTNYLMIFWSKWYTLCSLCSPCYPNAGDLDAEGVYATYCLPPDMLSEEDKESKKGKILPVENLMSTKLFLNEKGSGEK